MNNLYKAFEEKKKEITSLEAPSELESRLQDALSKTQNQQQPPRQRLAMRIVSVAAVFLFLFMAIFNYPTLAYYGRKILGYDSVISHNLQALNDAGKGQIINKSYTFKNGIVVTLKGIMSDKNELIAFITIKSKTQNLTQYSLDPGVMAGFMTRLHPTHGTGQFSSDKKTMKYVQYFSPPSFFTQHVTYTFGISGPRYYSNQGKIQFNYDRNKAMAVTVQKTIHQSVILDQNQLSIKDLTATPTSTVLTGSMNSNYYNQRINGGSPATIIKLKANGKDLRWQGGGVSTNGIGKAHFTERYDPLPQPLSSLQIVIEKAPYHDPIKKKWSIQTLTKGVNLSLPPNHINVLNKKINNHQTELQLSILDTMKLGPLSIQANGHIYKGKQVNATLQKDRDGTITRKLTYQFDTTATSGMLILNGYDYSKAYHKVLTIDVKK